MGGIVRNRASVRLTIAHESSAEVRHPIVKLEFVEVDNAGKRPNS
jgi:hypothetical protein